MASSHLKSPVFLSLTFYGQNQVSATSPIVVLQKKICLFRACQIVVNTNGNGHLIDDALRLVSEALGPFRYEYDLFCTFFTLPQSLGNHNSPWVS